MKKLFFTILLLFTCYNLFSQTTSQRVVLFELFTSTTCPPCATANPYFDNWYQNSFTQQSNLAIIKYHVWWPATGDPFYLSDPIDVTTRNNYYSNNYVPHGFLDGSIDAGSNYYLWPTNITTELSVNSPLSINIVGMMGSNGGKVTINIKSNGSAIPKGTLILQTAMVESSINYTGSNGDPTHNFIMRKMYPDANGEIFTINSGESKNIIENITVDPSWNTSNCALIAFVQVNETKVVLQAVKNNLLTLTAIEKKDSSIPSNFSLMQNYPNPFNPTTTINYSLPKSGLITLKIYDLLGREVETLVNENKPTGNYSIDFNASKLVSGVYFYRMQAGDFVQTKKLILIK